MISFKRFQLLSICAVLSISSLPISCTPTTTNSKELENPQIFRNVVQNLTDISVYDIFSPPVASRVYVYPSIAAYEVIASAFPDRYQSLAGQLNGLTESPQITVHVNPYLAAIYAYNIVGKSFIFSEDKMTDFQMKFDERVKEFAVSRRVRKNSMRYAEQISSHILTWSPPPPTISPAGSRST